MTAEAITCGLQPTCFKLFLYETAISNKGFALDFPFLIFCVIVPLFLLFISINIVPQYCCTIGSRYQYIPGICRVGPLTGRPRLLHQMKHFRGFTCRVKLGRARAAKPSCALLFDTNDICGIMGFYGGAHARRTNSAAPLNLFKRAICHLLTFRWR